MKRALLLITIVLLLSGCRGDRAEFDPALPLAAFGDSLTSGYGASRGYPEYLAEILKVEVVNMGVSGETTGDALRRVDEVEAVDPGIIIIGFGANDYLQRIPVERTGENLRRIVEALRSEGRTIFLVKFYPRGGITGLLGRGVSKKYDPIYEKLGRDEDVYIVEDIWKGVWKREMSDGVHPNGRGYEIMGETYKENLRRVFGDSILKKEQAGLLLF